MTPRGCKHILISVVLLNLLTVPAMRGQQVQQPVPVEELISAFRFARDWASLSADGQWLAYTVQDPRKIGKVDEPQHSLGADIVRMNGADIWLTNTLSGDTKNITHGVGANWGPVWSPDYNYLAFYSVRDGKAKANLWIYDRRSDTSRKVSDGVVIPVRNQVVRWTPDSRKVLMQTAPEERTTKGADRVPMDPQATPSNEVKQPGSTVIIYRSHSAQQNSNIVGPSRTKEDTVDLALIDVETGRIERITHGLRFDWYDVSPDGLSFAFATLKGLLDGFVHRSLFDLAVVRRGKKPTVIASDIRGSAMGFSASWSPDGKWLSYIGTEEGYADGECYLVPTSGGPARKAAQQTNPGFNYFLGAPIWDLSGKNLYFLGSYKTLWTISLPEGEVHKITEIPGRRLWSIVGSGAEGRFASPDGGRSMIVAFQDSMTQQYGFYQIDLATKKTTELLKEDKVYNPRQVHYSTTARTLIYLAQDVGHEPNFWMVGMDSQEPRQLTDINPRFHSYLMGKSKLIEWRDLDGQAIRGALLLPANYKEGKRYPLIVNVYGGGALSLNLNCFGLNPDASNATENKQLFATRGYAILSPDAPLGVGTPLRDLVKTVLPAVDRVIELGIADPDRLGLMGVSYGGYSTLGLIVQTTRFKAAMMTAGFGDLIGFAGEMDKGGASLGQVLQEQWWSGGRMPGSPWQARDAYIENSPVFYLDRVQTPLLIMHGTSDRNVAPFLSDQIFVFLRRLGKEVVYAKYEGEGHVISGYANQIDYCERMIAWFDAYLKAGEEKPRH